MNSVRDFRTSVARFPTLRGYPTHGNRDAVVRMLHAFVCMRLAVFGPVPGRSGAGSGPKNPTRMVPSWLTE